MPIDKPHIEEGAGTLAHIILQNNSDGRSLSLLTSSLRAIYDKGFNIDDFVRYTGLSPSTVERLQNWYLSQRLKHSYGKLHDAESERLIANWGDEVTSRNTLRDWRVNNKHQALIESFQADKHYGLKNFVEIIARALVEEKIRGTGVYESVKVSVTSDADDIVSGVDLIIECIDKSGKKHIIGVDIAVSENLEYLDGKSEKLSCNPSEFFFRKGMDPKTSIHRIVFALNPAGVARVIERSVEAFQKGDAVNPKLIANTYALGTTDSVWYGVNKLVQGLVNR